MCHLIGFRCQGVKMIINHEMMSALFYWVKNLHLITSAASVETTDTREETSVCHYFKKKNKKKQNVWLGKQKRLRASAHKPSFVPTWGRPAFINVLKPEFATVFWWWGDWHGCVYIQTILRTLRTDPPRRWPKSCVFASSPSSSAWLALMDTTCTFHILCACNIVGRDQGSAWAHPFALPQAVVLVMKVHWKHEHAKYLSPIQTQSWFHSSEI